MQLLVLECDWGGARIDNIQRLLQDVASHIVRELRHPFNKKIHVLNLPTVDVPRTFFRLPSQDHYDINLTASGTKWSQFSYQFAHEFCHVLSRHDRSRNNPNSWFHEALCELASIYVLRRMSESWRTNPPYDNWDRYAGSLEKYVQDVVEKHRAMFPIEPFHTWLAENEEEMRRCSVLRDKNGVVALRLLPIFETHRQGWNTVPRLPTSAGRIAKYIEDWRASVEDVDRAFVEEIGDALGVR